MSKIYKVESFDSFCYGVSLVDDPAIEKPFIALSKQERRQVILENQEKRMVYGPALIPDQLIFRRDEYTGEEFYLQFSAKAIAELSRKYLTAREVTLDHERYADGVFVQESWLKADMEKDKSVALGLDAGLPVGTWFLGMYVDSNDVWQQVKEGRWYGFSIEAFVSTTVGEELRKTHQNNDSDMRKDETFINKLKNLFEEYFSAPEAKDEELAEQAPAVEEEAKEEAVEPEESLTEDADEQPVQQELAVEEAEPAEEEEEPEEGDRVAELEQRIADLEGQLADVLDRLAKANLESEELRKQNAELSKQPSAKPVDVHAGKQDGESVMDTLRALRDGTYFKS